MYQENLKRRIIRGVAIVINLALVLKLCVLPGLAYEASTHRVLTRLAVKHAQQRLDDTLKQDLGLVGGISEEFMASGIKRAALGWMESGSVTEDDPPRVLNHFHNPLRPVPRAGLHESLDGISSIAWGQADAGTQTQFPFVRRNMSWRDARVYFLNALTKPSSAERQSYFALTFEAVGHLMHLVQDSSVPAHVRDDAHPPGVDTDGFHPWVDKHLARVNNALSTSLIEPLGVVDPDESILRLQHKDQTSQSFPPAVNLIDTNIYTKTNLNPDITIGVTIGLAEFTSANFFSDDTITVDALDTDTPHPNLSDMPPFTDPALVDRKYRSLFRNGNIFIRRVARESLLNSLTNLPIKFSLDERVYQEYAEKLLPRAVGYSATLLSHFFRGAIDVQADGLNSIKLRNKSTSDDMSGAFELFYDAVDGKRYPIPGASWSLIIGAGQTSAPQSFSAPVTPAPSDPGKYILVFKGKLGGEESSDIQAWPGAVVGKSFTIRKLNVIKSGAGSGTIISTPSGISCGSDCISSFVDGTAVSLAAAPDPGFTFKGWSGDCVGNNPQTTILITQDRQCTAEFTHVTHALSVIKSGLGTGTVNSSPAGVSCGPDCTAVFTNGSSVTLTANPAAGSSFSGWSGDCAGTSSTATVMVSSNKSCTANFTVLNRTCRKTFFLGKQTLSDCLNNQIDLYLWASVTQGQIGSFSSTDVDVFQGDQSGPHFPLQEFGIEWSPEPIPRNQWPPFFARCFGSHLDISGSCSGPPRFEHVSTCRLFARFNTISAINLRFRYFNGGEYFPTVNVTIPSCF